MKSASAKSKTTDLTDPHEILKWASDTFGGKVAFATSLGAEDQVVLDMIAELELPIKIFTLDTGRLPPETYQLLAESVGHYNIPIDVCFPNTENVEKMVAEHGINLFYESLENRKLCCKIRKVDPLRKALGKTDAWITGLRREQSVTRDCLEHVHVDDGFGGITKINPLTDWTEADTWKYIREKKVPYNVLHDRSYPSLGCAPCTRSVGPGINVRAGRWWWEDPEAKECGLHSQECKNGGGI